MKKILKVTEHVTEQLLTAKFYEYGMDKSIRECRPMNRADDIQRWQYRKVSITLRKGEIELETEEGPFGGARTFQWLDKKLSHIFRVIGWLIEEV